jgi:hypothetical protein
MKHQEVLEIFRSLCVTISNSLWLLENSSSKFQRAYSDPKGHCRVTIGELKFVS